MSITDKDRFECLEPLSCSKEHKPLVDFTQITTPQYVTAMEQAAKEIGRISLKIFNPGEKMPIMPGGEYLKTKIVPEDERGVRVTSFVHRDMTVFGKRVREIMGKS